MSHFYLVTLLLGCSLIFLGGCGSEPTQVNEEITPTFAPVATYTPTPRQSVTLTIAETPTSVPAVVTSIVEISASPPPTVAVIALEAAPALTSSATISTSDGDLALPGLVPTPAPESIPTTSAQPTTAQLTVLVDAANVRDGPGTEYAQIGVVTRNATYPIAGRNEFGDWWQFCCINEQPGWLFSALVTVQNSELVSVVAAPPPPIPPTAEPVAEAVPEQEPALAETAPPEAQATPIEAAPAPTGPGEHSGTAGNFDPNAQYQIVHYRVLGFADNNGGIFNKGGQHHIFVTVLDQNGNGVDGAVVKDAVDDKLNVVTGSKGPGKAEIEMYWDRYKLYVVADPSGAVTSQISNQMNTAYPHIPDIVGLLGPTENEYAICPTVDDRCTPPFYHAHWSYEITFRKVK